MTAVPHEICVDPLRGSIETARLIKMLDLDLQRLKCVVDTIGTSNNAALQAAVDKHVHTYHIRQIVWLQALSYTEQRIGAIEIETFMTADRVLELADIVPGHENSEERNVAASAKRDGNRAIVSDSVQGARGRIIVEELVKAITALAAKENRREELKAMHLRMLEDVRKINLFHWLMYSAHS